MAITVTTNTLSTNAKYINYSASTAADDCASIVVAVNNVLVDDFGWEKYDSASAGTASGTSGNRFCIWRKPSYDFATTGHYMYLGMRISSNGTTHTLYFNYSADRSSNNTFTGTVNMSYSSSSSVFDSQTEWNFGSDTLITYGSSGTIWLFNDFGNSLVMCFLGSNRPIGGRVGHSSSSTKNVPTTVYFGQYRKDFGEVVPNGEYIHNGVNFSGYDLWAGFGIGPGNGSTSNRVAVDIDISRNGSTDAANHVGYAYTIGGTDIGQSDSCHLFVLTEYSKNSSRNSKTVVSPVSTTSTTSVFIGTRMLLGWVGWVGHVGRQMGINAAGVFTRSTTFSQTSQLFATGGNHPSNSSLSQSSSQANTPGYWWGENLPGSANSINLFEPVISAGSYDNEESGGLNTFFYGKMYGVRITGGQPSISNGGYTLLDSATIPLDANGFYDPNGTNTDCWCVPIFSSEQGGASVDTSACIWVKK